MASPKVTRASMPSSSQSSHGGLLRAMRSVIWRTMLTACGGRPAGFPEVPGLNLYASGPPLGFVIGLRSFVSSAVANRSTFLEGFFLGTAFLDLLFHFQSPFRFAI